ncbi:MAG: rod shape-determining protein MreC, partial [Chitinophagales bacterium]|nr:rod shape-determining protein MreC [Chitinophagales bacterium]
YFNLKEVNNNLAQENAYLKSRLKEVEYTLVPTIYEDSILVNDTIILDTLYNTQFITAKIISSSINKQLNTLYINKGSKQGIYQDMGVVNQDGVVGIVRNISKNYATVTPIINREFNINAKIKGAGYFGNLNWDGKDPKYAQLYDIPNHYEPVVGDTIITSGYSHVFKEGYIIGYITESDNVPGKSFLNIQVELAVDFGNLNYIYGIENKIQAET